MSRSAKIFLVLVLAAGVVIGGFYLPKLYQRVDRLAQLERTEEQARREVVHPMLATPTDVKVKAKIFWASAARPSTLEPTVVELPLSRDPVERAKQLITTLIVAAPSSEERTLPADVTLLEFYLLGNGTAVADFSATLATATPSGILSERLAVESIARTLEANIEQARRLKILIQGQEAETLAGHLDLTGFFPVRSETPPASPAATSASGLTPSPAPGKLNQ